MASADCTLKHRLKLRCIYLLRLALTREPGQVIIDLLKARTMEGGERRVLEAKDCFRRGMERKIKSMSVQAVART